MTKPAPGVSTFALPLPWELKSVNVHLIELDEGYLLVDSGVATEACFEALQSQLAEAGIDWRDIRILLLTHLHPDHIGLSWKIRELSGARLLMHAIESEYLATLARGNRAPFFERAMSTAGVPLDLQTQMTESMRDVRRHFREHAVDWPLTGGERIPVRGGSLEVVWTPGHSPGHICLYSPEHRYLISGDHILQFITPNIGWRPEADTLAQYLDSLEKLAPIDIDLVIPSHGSPFRGHRERIRETAGHHAERCAEILGHIAREPLTAHGLVVQVWPRRLSPFHLHFAVNEILAHLEYLKRRGQVASEARNGGALYWAPTKS